MENCDFDTIYSKNVIEFVTVAGEFCGFLEKSKDFSRKEILEKLQKLLPLLYLKGTLLPNLESVFEEVNEKFVTEQDWEFIRNAVLLKIGKFDEFLETFDPRMEESETPVICSISENIADIYQDVKNFIMLYRVGANEIMNDAIWECKNNFEEFWGQKAANTIRAIHNLVVNEDLEQEDSPTDKPDKDDMDTGSWFISKRQKDFQSGKQ